MLEIEGMNAPLTLLDCLDWGVAVTDVTGQIQVWNRAAVELTGISEATACGRSIYPYFPGLERHISPVQLSRSRDNLAATLRWQRHRASTSDDPALVDLLVSLKYLPEEDAFASEGGSAGIWVWGFRVQSVAIEQAHADFIATVSHELRTPLTSVKGFIDTLLDCHDRLKPEQQRHFLLVSKSQVERLIRMVEDVLLVSQIQTGQLQQRSLQHLSLPETFRRVKTEFSDRQRQRLRVNTPTEDPTVWADPERLDQILHQLIDNALKYSADTAPVDIIAERLTDPTGWVRVRIIDRGAGIAPERLPSIFNRFQQNERPLTRDREGTGLGLYIAKSLVESLGGTLAIDSTVGQGTTCEICLPSLPPNQWSAFASRDAGGASAPEWVSSAI
ncbi:MAG: ATP-binding protein [Cyanobacteria bacterium J06639_1]